MYYCTLAEALNKLQHIPYYVAVEKDFKHYIEVQNGAFIFRDTLNDRFIKPKLKLDLRYKVMNKKEYFEHVQLVERNTNTEV